MDCERKEPELFVSCDGDCDNCFANKEANPYLLNEDQINKIIEQRN